MLKAGVMAHKGVLLPVHQNWSCHNCGGCCREHQIVITAEEKKRIERQRWTSADGIADEIPTIVPHGSEWRLNHRSNGACVFLDDHGLCRIHARYGESAKPLACRAFPYAIHPAGPSVTTSLRFSCPSVVQNLGIPVKDQRQAIEFLAAEIVPPSYTAPAAPDFCPGTLLEWDGFTRIQAFIERGLSEKQVHFAVRLMRILSWLDLLENAEPSSFREPHLQHLLTVLHDASIRAQPDNDLPIITPSRLGRLLFRQLIAQLIRHDTETTARSGPAGRLRLLSHGLRFTIGLGTVPECEDPMSVRTAWPETTPSAVSRRIRFSQMESPCRGRTAEIDELFQRYFQVKVQGIHFCGRANYDLSVLEGFRSLALMYPATLWVAQCRALQRNRSGITFEDVQAALATLDHNYGYSPALGMRSARNRITQLARLGQITALCGWYSI